MADWNYGEDGLRFPVQPNQLWRVGQHWFACGDLQDGIGDRFLDAVRLFPDMGYSDPPWNKGNAKAFRTKAGLTGDVNFESLLESVVNQVRNCSLPVFLEMGRSTVDLLATVVHRHGGGVLNRWGITYYGKKPCELIAVYFREKPAYALPDFTGKDDSKTPYMAIEAVKKHSSKDVFHVYDPCVGRGLTAEAAIQNGAIALGVELSPHRLSVTLSKVQRLTAEIPKLEAVI